MMIMECVENMRVVCACVCAGEQWGERMGGRMIGWAGQWMNEADACARNTVFR